MTLSPCSQFPWDSQRVDAISSESLYFLNTQIWLNPGQEIHLTKYRSTRILTQRWRRQSDLTLRKTWIWKKHQTLNLRWMARSRGMSVGLLGGEELVLWRLRLLSMEGDACTVILCWKSATCTHGQMQYSYYNLRTVTVERDYTPTCILHKYVQQWKCCNTGTNKSTFVYYFLLNETQPFEQATQNGFNTWLSQQY